MPEYIEREAVLKHSRPIEVGAFSEMDVVTVENIKSVPAADVVEVVRCQDCIHAEPLERNCEISTSLYMHCGLWRGDETRYVWHKYKKYFRDYSLVSRDDYCSEGVKMDGKGEDK